MIAGRKSEVYKRLSAPVFRPDGGAVAFVVGDGGAASELMLLDGPDFGHEQVLAHGDIGGEFTFSPDGSRLAYLMSEGDRQHVVVDGKRGPDFLKISGLRFSPDGRLVYAARDFLPEGMERRLPRDGFSPDAKEIDGKFTTLGAFIVINGRRYGEMFAWVGDVVFSPDGRRIVYPASGNFSGQGQCTYCLVTEGTWLPLSDDARPTLSSDGKHLAYRLHKCLTNDCSRPVTWVVVDGRPGPEFKGIIQQNIKFSPDGTRLAYELSEKDDSGQTRNFIVVDGRKFFGFGRNTTGTIASIVFSPDGRHLAHDTGINGKDAVVLDGHIVARFDQGGWSPVFSPDSRHLAYRAQRGGKWHVGVVDSEGLSQEGPPCDEIETRLFFSPDGKKVAYGARNGRDLWWKVLEVR